MSNPIGWVEIPVKNMARAITFYNDIFDWSLEDQSFGDLQMAMFPSDPDSPGASGALVYGSGYAPTTTNGVHIYFSCDDCTEMDDKTERAGGRIITPKTPIGEYGYMSVCEDTEGNLIGFHSMQ